MRNGAVFISMEEKYRASCLSHVEEDRRSEQGRKKFYFVLRIAFYARVLREIFHSRQRDKFSKGLMEKYLTKKNRN